MIVTRVAVVLGMPGDGLRVATPGEHAERDRTELPSGGEEWSGQDSGGSESSGGRGTRR